MTFLRNRSASVLGGPQRTVVVIILKNKLSEEAMFTPLNFRSYYWFLKS